MKYKSAAVIIIGILSLSLTACTTDKADSNKYTGTIECNSYYITSEVAGKIDKVNVSEGDKVKKDDVTFNINSEAYNIQKNQADAEVEAAEATKDSLPDNAPDNTKKQADAKLKEANAALDLANLNIGKCDVKSPGDGVVSEVLVNSGEVINQGGNLAKVLDIDNRYIKVYVEQSKRDKVKLNDKLNIYYNDKNVGKGTVSYISPQAEFTPKNTETKSDKEETVFEVKVKVDNNLDYSPGTLMDVEIK
ncbi:MULTISPECIES: HlyD family secretion protein [Clostridium]|uniref:HlyD family secretion protein n=1 Tax=Clostridium TaxID=1485 RepID=UPI0008252CEA|nr:MULTISPECIES: HlyD family efflux transporter periplasmic adaptor subunit [Clostridium]PJI08732.1 hemolysin D [Clostridium sp. CT7]